MKIYTSYFYMVRFFLPYQIPISTAVWDPKWFHDFKDQNYVWKDKNGVWNGIRMEELNPKNCNACGCPCGLKLKDPLHCKFITTYREGLSKINFKDLYECLEKTGELLKFEDYESEIMLLVHEAPDNPCSERLAIQELFKDNGIDVCEWIPG